MDSNNLFKILNICSSIESVKSEVKKNHDNNLWWPLDIIDYRKRLLIAGLSTRISYNMIETYRSVIKELDKYSYEDIKELSKEKIISIIKPLGLINSRYDLIQSMISFIEKYDDKILNFSNRKLINLIATEVKGASYKIGQCCTLYIHNYHCGIMPVDSGMKDIFLPCIGFNKYNKAFGHELCREELELTIKNLDLKKLIIKNGYDDLQLPNDNCMNWWAHLVLIYFKRQYCNKHKPQNCPLKKAVLAKEECLKTISSNI